MRARDEGTAGGFSDGVIAIIITIMVLELRPPATSDLHGLRELRSDFLAYLLSFVFPGIYWNNHHHMLHASLHVTGGVLWANLHLLFWLSLNAGGITPMIEYGSPSSVTARPMRPANREQRIAIYSIGPPFSRELRSR